MELSSIDWKAEEIRLHQQKNGAPLVLPLTAVIGNSIYDYTVNERPQNIDPQLLLGVVYPHYFIEAGAFWHISSKIYK